MAIRNAKVWTAFLLVTAVAAAPGAQIIVPTRANATPAVTPGTQGPSTSASTPQAPQIAPYVVGQAKPPETPGSPVVDLSLEKAIQIAFENNLDLQSARINPIVQDISIRSSRANFLPTFSGSFAHDNSSRPVTNTILDGGLSTITSTGQSYQFGMNQNSPWYGGRLTTSFSSGRSASNDPGAPNNPAFTGGWSANYSQPLFANFKIDNTRNSMRVALVNRQVADITLQNSIENLRAQVRQAYWTLRQRIESIEIQRRSLELAKRQLDESKQKIEIGAVAPIDATNFETAVADAEANLLGAEINWRTQELTFKRLLVNGASDPVYASTINPTEQPLAQLQAVDIQGAIQNALAQRTDLEQSRKNLQVSEMNLELRRNALLPAMTLSGGYRMSGSGGPRTSGGVLTPGGYGQVFGSMVDRPSWNINLSYSYNFGLVAARASLAQQELQYEQSKITLKGQELTVTQSVTQAGLNVNNAFRQLEARKKALIAQEKNADAAQTRFTVGLANPFEVANALQSLTNARLAELNAIITYLNAVAEFEKQQRVGG